ncbi:unnamed protein product [Rodentolepis nana]|uniref:Recep_L_domain domain-containing protein n=1 Tax=Rodentolepis nana TaxID=102285 RepID=A0A0R3TW00_RODNA|nr:unnamed protein product [Rodentolepis nana]
MGPNLSLFYLMSAVLLRTLAQQSPNSENCPFSCFLSTDKELLCSTSSNESFSENVSCQNDLINERYVIGNRSSIRRISPGGLKDLRSYGKGGVLNIFLDMNILELTPMSFTGLEEVLGDLSVLHVNTLHPDTLLRHRKITSITFDSDRVPQLPDSVREKADVPAFLRLQPLDPSMPIEMNMEVRCHKCASEQPIQESAIVTFSRHEASKAGETLDTINMIYMDNCPTLDNALGCPKNGSLDHFILNASASTGWLVDEGKLKVSGGTTKMKPLLLSVIIWCTVLTILLICLIVALVLRFKIRAKKRNEERKNANLNHRCSATSLKHIICGTSSCDEIHRASLCNGGTWIYGTPSQNSCANLLCETRSQYSFRPPPFPGLGYPHLRGSFYSTDMPPGYRASIPDFLTLLPRNKSSLVNGDALLANGDRLLMNGDAVKSKGDPGLPPVPTSPSFRVAGTPSYKRAHDGTFRIVQP